MQLVINYHKKVSTTSLLVAEKFGKEHKNVLKAINNLECSPEFRELHFELSSYKSLQNRDLPMFIMTRDAFTMLVMSFTGEKSSKFREEFIEEFNRMEAILRQGETPVLIPVYQKRILSEPTKSCPDTHWNIFDASHNVMLFIEKNIGSVNKYDLADGSIGIHWSKFRKGKSWAVETYTYTHEYDDNRGHRECNCYDSSELQYFKKWIRETYKPIHLYNYLHNKYVGEKNRFMLDKVENLLPKLLLSA